jgi:putative addiction module killer protein
MLKMRKTDTFAQWLDGLRYFRARVRGQVRIERLAAGNAGDVKAVGEGENLKNSARR